MTMPRDFNKSCAAANRQWLRWLHLALLLVTICLLLLITGCASSAVQVPDVPQTSRCNVSPSLLAPTPQPPMRDATNKDLIAENDEVRAALDSANSDKKRIKEYISTRCS